MQQTQNLTGSHGWTLLLPYKTTCKNGSKRFVPNRNVIYLREKLITFLALISTQWKESSPNLHNQTGDGPLTQRRNG
ncbi:unnamed protein product [Brassica oleracea]|uniref:Uncharacterized protein n=2 Tax=Brassica TaxID=3705 RepID=A0A3P6FYF7_BRAOL|nr:unnamed protein product [Brassica napus]VDD63433.1 unnamed protein product [Brassica oleracea]